MNSVDVTFFLVNIWVFESGLDLMKAVLRLEKKKGTTSVGADEISSNVRVRAVGGRAMSVYVCSHK